MVTVCHYTSWHCISQKCRVCMCLGAVAFCVCVCVAGQALVTVFCGWFTACQRVEKIKCAVWLLSFSPSFPAVHPFLSIHFFHPLQLYLSLTHFYGCIPLSLLQHKIADIKSFALFITLFQCANDFHILHEPVHVWCHALSRHTLSLYIYRDS